jgi:hypothetical protein
MKVDTNHTAIKLRILVQISETASIFFKELPIIYNINQIQIEKIILAIVQYITLFLRCLFPVFSRNFNIITIIKNASNHSLNDSIIQGIKLFID